VDQEQDLFYSLYTTSDFTFWQLLFTW